MSDTEVIDRLLSLHLSEVKEKLDRIEKLLEGKRPVVSIESLPEGDIRVFVDGRLALTTQVAPNWGAEFSVFSRAVVLRVADALGCSVVDHRGRPLNAPKVFASQLNRPSGRKDDVVLS